MSSAVSEPRALIGLIHRDISQAADAFLCEVELALQELRRARAGEPQALDRIEQALRAILEACAFQDLAGQRLGNLDAMLREATSVRPPPHRDPLLNGPAAPGEGLSQDEVDALMHAAPGS